MRLGGPARDEHPGPTGQVRAGLDVDERTRRTGRLTGRGVLHLGVLHHQEPPGDEQPGRRAQDRTRDVQPVEPTAVEGQVASSIVDATGPTLRLVRAGALSLEQLNEVTPVEGSSA